jgi:hypothetical protein
VPLGLFFTARQHRIVDLLLDSPVSHKGAHPSQVMPRHESSHFFTGPAHLRLLHAGHSRISSTFFRGIQVYPQARQLITRLILIIIVIGPSVSSEIVYQENGRCL